jgi:asparagine synthase (glutamine-hydrolysing)
MCGIAGIISPRADVLRDNVALMCAALSHRGPDDQGIENGVNFVLGHTRLSIVDISSGHQPMLSYDNNQVIVFNGEIYGYQELRKTIEYPYTNSSDTEVILAMYRKHADNLAIHLPGMFAFAIWDKTTQSLFCARDRFGEKPFYYAFGPNGEFIFASEIKAILASGLVRPRLSRTSLNHYLRFLYVAPDTTIYSNIHTLPPGHTLKYIMGNLPVINRYWSPAPVQPSHLMTEDDRVARFSSLLESAVKKQLIADVPVGAFLSGGLDSTTIVALASRFTNNLKTISFGFDGDLNELGYASAAARLYGTEHYEFHADDINLPDLTVKMASVYDEPFGDSSNIPTYLISQQAAAKVKVVLSGDGADELLAGYNWWYAPLTSRPERLAERIKETGKAVADRLLCRSTFRRKYTKKPPLFSDVEIQELFTKVRAGSKRNNAYFAAELRRSNDLNDALDMDLLNYMPGDILVKTDRASMANGLEVRAPFLDRDFAEFCMTLPADSKFSDGRSKVILRQAFEKIWPESIRNRDKQGFGAPVEKWLTRKEMQPLIDTYLRQKSSRIFHILNYNCVQSHIMRPGYKCWALLMLSLWLEVNQSVELN